MLSRLMVESAYPTNAVIFFLPFLLKMAASDIAFFGERVTRRWFDAGIYINYFSFRT